MKGDFSRDTFDPTRHFSRVLQQQGRVQLDADGNEQTAILLHYLRTLAADLIGPYGGPLTPLGFGIAPQGQNFIIGAGRYYVDGWLAENDADRLYDAQPDYPLSDAEQPAKLLTAAGGSYLVYLDVWERHLTYLDDAHLREVALGGPDTASRAKVVWQVKVAPQSQPEDPATLQSQINELNAKLAAAAGSYNNFLPTPADLAALATLQKELARLERRLKAAQVGQCAGSALNLPYSDARLKAQVKPADAIPDPCLTPPNSAYRGAENQLYRVEIHNVVNNAAGHTTTWNFKWSRDNGSVTAAIVSGHSPEITVSPARGFDANQWVELLSDAQELRNEPGPLVKIAKVDGDVLTLDLPTGGLTLSQATKVRRWDQTARAGAPLTDGAVPGVAGEWLDLEDGVQVQFEPGSNYRSGDYWLIPARVATGQIEWPSDDQGNPALLPPHGIEHHYAPLAVINASVDSLFVKPDCRLKFSVTLAAA